MDHKIILKCRVCLDEYDEHTMTDLFMESIPINENKPKQRKLKLYKKVEYCCGVRIRNSPDLPTKICMKCFDMTRMWYNFRQMCINSQVYLESLCSDRTRPENFDDEEYFEYLREDLQTFLPATSDEEALLNDSATEGSDYDSEDEPDIKSEEYLEERFPVFGESEGEPFENVLMKIKEEKEANENEHNEAGVRTRRGAQKTNITNSNANRSPTKVKLESANSPKKSAAGLKRIYRPPSPTTFMCSICGNVYNKKASFVYHMSLHNNVKPHECELCGKAFRQLCELKNHMRRHTGEKPYKCTYCDRHFIDRSEKHRHERVHTNTRPYICNVCGKSFMYSAILKNHSKLHTGRKDFNCMVCQKAFTLQHQLKAHLQTITHKQKEAQFVSAGYEVVYE